MTLTADAKGVFPIAPTPFLEDQAIDFASIDRLADFYVESGASGLTVLGVLGEAPKLDASEARDIAQRFIRRAPSLPVVVGVSAPGFAAMKALARTAMEAGAAGVMIAPPSSLRTDDQIVSYYAQAAEAVGRDVPFCIQDYPLNTSVIMAASVIRRIVADNPSCVMLKHEDWPGLDKLSLLRRWQEEKSLRQISILCGNNGMFLDFEAERGADGAMTGYPFPDMIVEMFGHSAAGRRDAAHDLFDAHLPLLRYEQQPGLGLAVRKRVLARRGVISSAQLRNPAPIITQATLDEVDYLLARIARVDARARL